MACICFPEDAPATRSGERYNFAAGPAMLPPAVLAQIQDELPDWRGSGQSLLELPFTGAPFKGLMQFSLGSALKSASKTFNELLAAAPLSIKPTNVDDKGVYPARAGETFTKAKMMINNLQGTPMENTDIC